MFTGIVEDLAEIKNLTKFNDYWKISISLKFDNVHIGDSVSVNGVCLTVKTIQEHSFSCHVVEQTLKHTNLASLHCGDCVNLERPLPVNGRLGGHIVQGHIDGVASLVSIDTLDDGSKELELSLPPRLFGYVIEQGSIAIEGISLTIAKLIPENRCLRVAIIPHTLKATHLDYKTIGDTLNIEIDLLAKYIANLQQPYHNSFLEKSV